MRTIRGRVAIGGIVLTMAGGAIALAPPRDDVPAVCPAVGVVPATATLEAPCRPEAAVSLDWSGPPAATLNKPSEYTLSVRNVSAQPAQKTVVQVRPPQHAAVQYTTPAAKIVDGVYLWELGTLEPKSAAHLKMMIAPTTRTDISCQAWVTFTGTAGMTVAVKEPKVTVKVSAPETVLIGETFPVKYTIKNIGDAPAENVRHALVGPTGPPNEFHADFKKCPVLHPNDEWTETVTVTARQGGRLNLSAAARGWGVAEAATADATVWVQVPKLTTTVSGPATVLIGRKATYDVRVQNSGDVPIADLAIKPQWPTGWRVQTTAPVNPSESPTSLLAPGESRLVSWDVTPTTVGTATIMAEAAGSHATRAVASCQTQVHGIAALRMELIDTVDPIEKGEHTTYEIRVTNTGTMADENVIVTCPLPEQFRLIAATGPVGYAVQDLGRCTVVRFDPIRELHPRTDAIYKITVKALSAGDVRFKAQLTSRHLTTSVAKEESTRIYGD